MAKSVITHCLRSLIVLSHFFFFCFCFLAKRVLVCQSLGVSYCSVQHEKGLPIMTDDIKKAATVTFKL